MRSVSLLVALSALLPAEAFGQVTQTSTSADPVARLRQLEAQIDLIEAGLSEAGVNVELLTETALTGEVGSTYGDIVHRNELGGGFRLDNVRYTLNGRVLLERSGPEARLDRQKIIPLFRGPIEAGDHVLEVEGQVQSGTFGVFSYAEAYRFKVRSKYVLRAREGRVHKLSIVFFEKPDVTLPPPPDE
ncbi:MAG: hypothetical protein HC923_01485 [Myxococcales bacterium]|nr:hypothetical protein [Myxococcales bacterium]